jgi:hypothetical protein
LPEIAGQVSSLHIFAEKVRAGSRQASSKPVGRRQNQTPPRAIAEGFKAAPASGPSGHDFSRIPVTPSPFSGVNPSDFYEREADRISAQVISAPPVGFPKNRLQPEAAKPAETIDPAVPAVVQEAVAGPGQSLEPATRDAMERRFGHDFSRVRIYADREAAESAHALHARAYTFGPNIVFGGGEFAPGTSAGDRLLAHELTHVLQQGGTPVALQAAPDDKSPPGGDLQLPWKHGDHSLFEVTSSGIRFLVAVGNDQEKTIRAAIPAIGKQIAADNAKIKDAAARVAICIIESTTTRFARWKGTPVLALGPSDADVETAAHEMGHAIFESLRIRSESKAKDAPGAGNFRTALADIFARLSDSKEYKEGDEGHPAGLWIADPSQWAPGSKKEHPWDDPDEFFASAKAAFQINRKGFEAAIARMKKIDPKVDAPAKELLALLTAFFGRGELPSKGPPKARTEAAEKELENVKGVTNVEDTITSNPPLDWLLNPANRPKQVKARPSLESPY